MRNKYVAICFTLILGGFGVHRMYLGQWRSLWYLLFFWTGIPFLISLIEVLYFLIMKKEDFDLNYNIKYIERKEMLKKYKT